MSALRVASTGLFFLSIFLTGVWLSRAGRPYGMLLLTVHKLVALAAIVFLVITIRSMSQAIRLGPIELAACVVAGVFFVGTIILGGLLATDKPMPAIISTMHQTTPYLTVLTTAAALYLVAKVG